MLMPKVIKNGLLLLSLMLVAVTPLAAVAGVSAQLPPEAKTAACDGIGGTGQQGCDDGAGTSLSNIVNEVINILSWIVGVVAIIVMILGGLKFITANGDANSVASAKRTIVYAMIGVAVAVSAQVLIRFVFNSTDSSVNSAAVEEET